MRTKQPKLKSLGDGTPRAIVLEDYPFTIVSKHGFVYRGIVPKGFITDGSSLPIGLLYDKFDPRMWVAFVVHDFGFFEAIIPRNVLDDYYVKAGKEGGMNVFQMKTARSGLYVGSWYVYNKNKKLQKKSPKKIYKKHGLVYKS